MSLHVLTFASEESVPISMKDRLFTFVRQQFDANGLASESARLKDDTSLIKSGLLDSANIVDLAIWIEREIGPGGVDLTTCDIAEEWDTPANIVLFVERHRKG